MVRIAVCDDNAEFLSDFKKQLQKEFSLRIDPATILIQCFTSGEQLLKAQEKKRFDLIFLDLELRFGKDGLEVGQHLQEQGSELVVVTGMNHLAAEACNLCHPSYFLRKDMLKEQLSYVVKGLVKKYRQVGKNYLVTKHHDVTRLSCSDILYIDVHRNNLGIHCADGTVYEQRRTFESVERELSPYGFVRTIKGCMVNLLHAVKLEENNRVILTNGEAISVSRKNYKNVLTAMRIFTEGAKS